MEDGPNLVFHPPSRQIKAPICGTIFCHYVFTARSQGVVFSVPLTEGPRFSFLRKLHAENEINWLEALPRALRNKHDRIGEEGLSPYQILLGRERPLTGLPYSLERESQEAQDYFDHIEAVDQLVAEHLNTRHQKTQKRHDAKVRARPEFR